jgi:hypothetical protein
MSPSVHCVYLLPSAAHEGCGETQDPEQVGSQLGPSEPALPLPHPGTPELGALPSSPGASLGTHSPPILVFPSMISLGSLRL